MNKTIKTKTNWRKLGCIFNELPKSLINRVDERIESGEEGVRVKHTSDKVAQDGSFNSLILDELSRVHAIIGNYYDAIEGGLSREDFIKVYCKD